MSACSERTFTISRGDVRCSYEQGHEKAHTHFDDDGRRIASWVSRGEFQAAKARGEFEPDYCDCEHPVPVCDDCGGEIR